MAGFGNSEFGQRLFGLSGLSLPAKRRVFVSYHHNRDQAYYNRFVQLFANGYEIITDNSLDRQVDSDNSDYQQQVIREKHISGSSITIVLCGAETWKRRWVDWEIDMTLNKQHGLLGIALPTAATSQTGKVIVPNRLHANINSGFAHWVMWTEEPQALQAAVAAAIEKARLTRNIDNSAPRMQRNSP